MKKKHRIISICCFAFIPVYIALMALLYDHFAHLYQSPANPAVNLTGLAGFFGTAGLITAGIINAVKAAKSK